MVFFVSAVLTVLIDLLGLAISLNYHPDGVPGAWSYLAGMVVLILFLGLLVIRSGKGAGWKVWRAGIILGGLGFAVYGAYRILTDPGDMVLWVWPFLMGVSLLVIAVGPSPDTKDQSS